MDDRVRKQMFALFRHANISDRSIRLRVVKAIICREVASTNELSFVELQGVVDVLDGWKRSGDLVENCKAAKDGRL